MFFSFYQDGEKVATRFSCKYVEISLVLNHNVDDLLVGIVRQARAQSRHDSSNLSSSTEKQRNKVRQFTNKLVKRWRKIRPKRSRCNNLFDAWCKRLHQAITNSAWCDNWKAAFVLSVEPDVSNPQSFWQTIRKRRRMSQTTSKLQTRVGSQHN